MEAYTDCFFSMFRNFDTLKRGNATGAPIQEMSAGVFGPVCRRVRIRTELRLARTIVANVFTV
jgi:hypothetical protein